MRIWRGVLIIGLLLTSALAHAFPNEEKGNLSLGLSQSTQFAISDDNTTLYVCYANKFKTVDTGTFALTSTQPFDISTDTTTYPGNFTGLIYFPSQNAVICPQDNGKAIMYNLNDITATPTILTLAAGKQLGKGVADTVGGRNIYVVDVTDNSIIQYDVTNNQTSQILLTGAGGLVSNFTVNNIAFSPQGTSETSEIYLSTSIGAVLYFPLGSPAPSVVTVDSTLSQQLQGIAPTPNKLFVYVVNSGATTVSKIQISDHSVVDTFSLTPNGLLNQLLVTTVSNPDSGSGTAVYGYVAGNSASGVSIFNTSDDSVFDFDVTDSDDDPLTVSGIGPMVASTNTDGYIYISAASGNIGVVTANPWVTVNSITYSGGGSTSTSLGVGGTATVNFQADETGTYTVRVGGSITNTSGTLITDSYGSTSGTVAAADTAQNISIPYDSNSSAFQEGSNAMFIFVTDSYGNVGRINSPITVDTPPTAVTVLGTSFGNTRAYINFSRLTANDIDYYNLYADTDPVAVTTKTTVSATVDQGSDSTLTGAIGGLTNGTLYYLAIEGVDNAGNVGPRTSTLSSGAAITATPELTVGPAGYTGETGCTLSSTSAGGMSQGMVLGILIAIPIVVIAYRRLRGLGIVIIIASVMMHAAPVYAQLGFEAAPPSEPAPIKKYGWFVDGKFSLWQPTSSTTKLFFPAFFNWQGSIEGGFLYNEQIGAELGVGFFYKTGNAIAPSTGAQSQDTFTLLTVPMTIGGSYRFLYTRKQPVVPYVRGGFEMDYFRENDGGGSKIQGLKKGLYGGGGLLVPITSWMDELDVERQSNGQVYLMFEGLYKWLNDFGGNGLNLSGAVYSLGFMVTF